MMLRSIALAVLLALGAGVASAQMAVIAPTAPNGANNNQIATTAWVNGVLSGGVSPSGAAGGGLTGTYPNPTVAAVPASALPALTGDCTTTAGTASTTCTKTGGVAFTGYATATFLGAPASWTIASGTVSAQASTTIAVSGSPKTIQLFIEQLDVSLSGTDVQLQVNGDAGGNYQFAYSSVGTDGTVSGGGALSQGSCKLILDAKAGYGARATVTLNAPQNVAINKHLTFQSAQTNNTNGHLTSVNGSCFWSSSAEITSVTVLTSNGTASFQYQMVGYK